MSCSAFSWTYYLFCDNPLILTEIRLVSANNSRFYLQIIKFELTLQSQNRSTSIIGSLAEWLGTGLQNRLQQFESARNLKDDESQFILYTKG